MGDKKGVGSSAFMNQATITSAEFGKDCCYVGDNAFAGCKSLSGINKNNAIETIHANAFAECTSLETVEFVNVELIEENAFAGCEKLKYVGIPKCNNIGDAAFKDCKQLYNVEKRALPQQDANIYDSAFENCSELTNIYLENCVGIGNNAFENCSKLSGQLNLSRCQSIGDEAFKNCTAISKLILSNCNVGMDAFLDCQNLQKVYIDHVDDVKYPCHLENDTVFCTYDETASSKDKYSVIDNILFYFNADIYNFYTNEINAKNHNWHRYIDNMIMMVGSREIIYTSKTGKIEEINGRGKNEGIESHEYNGKYGIIKFKTDITSLPNIFYDLEQLTSIDIPSKCERIEEERFKNCKNLKNINLSDVLEMIGDYAFKNCESLTSFTIPSSVYALGEGIFAGCKNIDKFEGNEAFVKHNGKALVYNGTLICVLPKDDPDRTSLIYNIDEIDENISKLGQSCFSGCENMVRVNIPQKIYRIDNHAFENCTNLYEIHFSGSTPPEIGNGVFDNISSDYKIFVPEEHFEKYLEKWKGREENYVSHVYPKPSNNSIIYYGESTNAIPSQQPIEYDGGIYYKITNVGATLPETYFAEQKNITKVILGESISKISKGAFKDCTNLEYIYLPDSITEFNNQCFYNCSSLKRIHIPIGLKDYSFSLGTGFEVNNSSGAPSTYSTRDVNITVSPMSPVNTFKDFFGSETFYGCTNLTEFGSYHKGYVTKDKKCYVYNSALKFFAQGDVLEYTIPDDINITSINKYAFKGCTKLNTINLNKNVKTIGDYAFANCGELQFIRYWDSVETISKGAFMECKTLGALNLPSNLKIISENAFNGCSEMYLDDYIPESVTRIGDGAFKNCKKFIIRDNNGTIEFNNTYLISINKSTFEGCTSLRRVIIHDGVVAIDDSAFAGCTMLEEITLDKSSSALYSINANAFKGCTKLSNIVLPDRVSKIGDSAFEGCVGLKKVRLPSNLQTLSHNCFATGSNIEITIPTDLTTPPMFRNLSVCEPFGAPQNDYKKVKISLPFQLECTYVNNFLWAPYMYQFEPYGDMGYLENYLSASVDRNGIHLNFRKNGNIPFRWTNYKVGYMICKENVGNNEIYQPLSYFDLSQDMSDINKMPYTYTIKEGSSYYEKIRSGNYFIRLTSSLKLNFDINRPDDEKYSLKLKGSDIYIRDVSTVV